MIGVRVWIDMSNSPHPLLFGPIARALADRGAEIVVSARDNAQTRELTLARWPGAEVIGGESPGGRTAKAAAIVGRVRALASFARRHRPDVALSHNSYAQIAAARLAGIPAVTAMDFEHQPANQIGFRLARTILLPEAIPSRAVRGQGAKAAKVIRYPGFKEEIYLAGFEPTDDVLRELGLSGTGRPLIVVRTAPTRAAYHRFGNPLLDEALERIATLEVDCVVLTRHPEQRQSARLLAADNVIIPDRAVDSRSLMYHSDLFVGAGGTMTREAALIGVPTFTLFAGKVPAVDAELEREGRLRRLTAASQIDAVAVRERDRTALERLRARAPRIVDAFCTAVAEAGTER